jgi:hypothetical protein
MTGQDAGAGDGTRKRPLSRLRRGMSRVNSVSLERRITELEAEMQEARRLNRRVAELLDIVEELLVPLSQRDEEKVRAYLDKHTSPL